jgi:mannan endo-1,4-beta-mannosidase
LIRYQKQHSKIMKKLLLGLSSALFITGEVGAQIDGGVTTQTKNLYYNLKEIAWDKKEILFGQEFFNSQSYAINPQDDPAESDYKSTTGDHPAVLGQDFEWYISKSWELSRMKAAAQHVYNNGGVLTFDYHMLSKYHAGHTYSSVDQYLMYNIGNGTNGDGESIWFDGEMQKVVNVLNDLQMPVVVRLFHEMNGNWFWWGTQAYGGSNSYIKMYKRAVDYIKARTDYALFAWSPNYPFNSGNNAGTNYYPGDNYVDVVGVDMYDAGGTGAQPLSALVNEVTAVSDFSWNHNKIPVLSEVGNRKDDIESKPNYFRDVNQSLQSSNRGYKIAWMLTWVNKTWGGVVNNQPYIAYSGSSYTAKQGIIDFKTMSTTYNLSEARNFNMYDYSYKILNETLNTQSNNNTIFEAAKISIYPNPSSNGYFNLNLDKYKDVIVSVCLINIEGRKVFENQYILGASVVKIPVFGLKKGVFIVNIKSAAFNETQKLIIE